MSDSASPLASRWQRWWPSLVVAGLLAAFAYSGLSAIKGHSTTFDEIAHLTAGVSYWRHDDYRLQPENGNFPQRWAALGLTGGAYKFPDPESHLAWNVSDVWAVGDTFLFDLGNDADEMMFRGRAMIAVLGVALGWVIWRWSSMLFGAAGGLVSVGLYAFCPTALSHGFLTTSDMAASLFFMLSIGSLWALLQRVTWSRLAASCFSAGMLGLAKFSAPILVPIAAILVMARLLNHEPLPVGRREARAIQSRVKIIGLLGGLAVVHVIVAWAMIWTAYGWRYEMMNQPSAEAKPSVPWDMLLGGDNSKTAVVGVMREYRVLPEGYLFGLAYTLSFAEQRRAFLNGDFSIHGWRTFFPYCFLVKNPLALFPMIGLALAAVASRIRHARAEHAAIWPAARQWIYRTTPLWCLFFVYWAFAISSKLNIGHRHLLPTYAPMYILLGVAAWWLRPQASRQAKSHAHEAPASDASEPPEQPADHDHSASAHSHPQHEEHSHAADHKSKKKVHHRPAHRRLVQPARSAPRLSLAQPWGAAALVVCWATFAIPSWTMWPHYLTYFNWIAGGPSQGYKHLVDSSLDWGQELPNLARWLKENNPPSPLRKPVYFSYFGTGKPSYYGIEATMLPCFFDRRASQPLQPLTGGLYCISATMLQSVYLAAPGPWNERYEAAYQQTLQNLRVLEQADRENRKPELFRQTGEPFWAAQIQQYEQLRFARLAAYLRQRTPIDQVGNSILIFQLSDEDAAAAVFGPPLENGPVPSDSL